MSKWDAKLDKRELNRLRVELSAFLSNSYVRPMRTRRRLKLVEARRACDSLESFAAQHALTLHFFSELFARYAFPVRGPFASFRGPLLARRPKAFRKTR